MTKRAGSSELLARFNFTGWPALVVLYWLALSYRCGSLYHTGVARFVIKSVARFVSKSVARSSRLARPAWSCFPERRTFFQKTVLPNPDHDATVGFGPNFQAGFEAC